jgi:hypothetical protein
MVKQNGDYEDLFYCNVYHNCHGGFDTIQYCGHGLVSIYTGKSLRYVMNSRYGVKKVKTKVDVIGRKNDLWMEQIVMEKLCKLNEK